MKSTASWNMPLATPVKRRLQVIDSHTAGEGTRLVIDGLPGIPGEGMGEKMTYAQEHLAWLPGFLLREPRGHKDLYGALLTQPCHPRADVGVIFLDNEKFEPMCGHAVIGVVTSLLETKYPLSKAPSASGSQLPALGEEPMVRNLTLDTPAGPIHTTARLENGAVVEVSFDGAPSFVYAQDIPLHLPGCPALLADIAFGGNFFVLIDLNQVDDPAFALEPSNAARLADLGMRLLTQANLQVRPRHPTLPHIQGIIDLRFYRLSPGNPPISRNVVILGDHMIDRSPCGTGTCAEVALHVARGDLPLPGIEKIPLTSNRSSPGEPPPNLAASSPCLISESLLGTRFEAHLVGQTSLSSGQVSYPAVIVRITGRAFITGFNQLLLQEDDPFPQGFLI